MAESVQSFLGRCCPELESRAQEIHALLGATNLDDIIQNIEQRTDLDALDKTDAKRLHVNKFFKAIVKERVRRTVQVTTSARLEAVAPPQETSAQVRIETPVTEAPAAEVATVAVTETPLADAGEAEGADVEPKVASIALTGRALSEIKEDQQTLSSAEVHSVDPLLQMSTVLEIGVDPVAFPPLPMAPKRVVQPRAKGAKAKATVNADLSREILNQRMDGQRGDSDGSVVSVSRKRNMTIVLNNVPKPDYYSDGTKFEASKKLEAWAQDICKESVMDQSEYGFSVDFREPGTGRKSRAGTCYLTFRYATEGKRIDPETRRACTMEEMTQKFKGKKTPDEVKALWDKCKDASTELEKKHGGTIARWFYETVTAEGFDRPPKLGSTSLTVAWKVPRGS